MFRVHVPNHWVLLKGIGFRVFRARGVRSRVLGLQELLGVQTLISNSAW